jgi:NADH-quinone oxidoreductase subunit J
VILEVLFAAMCIGGALYAINAKQLMRGVLGLAVFFIGVAAFFGDMGAWYLAAGQLLLFVGGVVTLFVLAFNFTKPPTLANKRIGGIVVALAAAATMALFIPDVQPGASPSFGVFATQFFVQYGLIINVVLLMLLGAIMGAQYLLEDA